MKPSLSTLLPILIVILGTLLPAWAEEPAIDFGRDVLPILSNHCFACHGPDADRREADLRLDQRGAALSELASGHRAIVPSSLVDSELVSRITTNDLSLRMPPEENRPLTAAQIELLTRWIERGAPWNDHWSFKSPRRASLPAVNDSSWPLNAIDHFVLARLEQEGLEPNRVAELRTLLRRVTVDLTGLLATEEQVQRVLEDQRPDAYERYVDRLLDAPQYGERMATLWLDAARYADTNGYQHDNGREMWKWRDWVVQALNDNMPFDRFTIEQLAGDLLPHASRSQQIATGFHRNHGLNFEGGSIAEESRVDYVVDRINTTGTVWLGLTLGCAQCHDHKFDPITQRDYYRLFAFFNNIAEEGFAGEKGNAAPTLAVPWPEHDRRAEQLSAQLNAANADVEKQELTRDAAQQHWEDDVAGGRIRLPGPPDDALLNLTFDEPGEDRLLAATPKDFQGTVYGPLRFDTGRRGRALTLEGETRVDLGELARFERSDKFSFGGWVYATQPQANPILARVHFHGYDVVWEHGRIHVHLVSRWDINAIFVRTKIALPLEAWHHVMITYDGSSRAEGVRIYVDGDRQPVEILKDSLSGTIQTESPLHLGARNGETPERFVGRLDDVQIFARELTDYEVGLLAGRDPILDVIGIPVESRTPRQHRALRKFFLSQHDDRFRALLDRRRSLANELAVEKNRQLTTMVMQDRQQRRPTHLLVGGKYDQPGKAVDPGVPTLLSPWPEDAPDNRRGLAQWLVDPRHPLTSRVAVNRYWQSFFGAGLVRTAEDFGIQGERPTHPQLLDWLATEFIQQGWDVKAMHRLLVTSATYRQSSVVTEPLRQRDPENRLLARQSRFRLPAEMIRDTALQLGGLLSLRRGGPAVMPYQPEGLWSELSFMSGHSAQQYVMGSGEDRHRRSLYTFQKRTCPPPAMQILDASDRTICRVRRVTTNTPLQALVLMNDPTFWEAARGLARQTMSDPQIGTAAAMEQAFCRSTGRHPRSDELELLTALYDQQRESLASDPEAAGLLANNNAASQRRLDPIDLAAMTSVMHVILSLDESISRN